MTCMAENDDLMQQCMDYGPGMKSMPIQMGLARLVRAVSCNVVVNMTSCGDSGADANH